MASLTRDMTVGMQAEFRRVLSAAGFDVETVRGIIKRPEEADKMLAAIKGEGGVIYRDLIHGRFVTPDRQIANLERWNAEYDWGFSEQAIKELPTPPAWPMDNKLCAVVLVPYLATPWETVVALGKIFARTRLDGTLETGIHGVDMGQVRIGTAPKQTHVPSIAWEVVDLGAYAHNFTSGEWGAPCGTFDRRVATGGVLAAAAHHPIWAHQIDGTIAPRPYTGGYWVQIPGKRRAQMIELFCRPGEERVRLSFGEGNWSDGGDSTPVVLNR